MKTVLSILFILMLSSVAAVAQNYKVADIEGKVWHCYTTSDEHEPPWNGRKSFTMIFNTDHTFIKKLDGAVSAFGGHWDLSYAGTMIQIRGSITADFTILFCNEDFLKIKNTTGAIYYFIRQQEPPAKQ